ncbi:hypothetical protein RBB50_010535 [Rhinocladiella similis]
MAYPGTINIHIAANVENLDRLQNVVTAMNQPKRDRAPNTDQNATDDSALLGHTSASRRWTRYLSKVKRIWRSSAY